MNSQWYYTHDLQSDNIIIAPDEAHHLVHVVRVKQGEEIIFTNGSGTVVKAVMQNVSLKNCSAEVISRTQFDVIENKLHLAFAPTKNIDRTEWMLERATEMGVYEFTPLRCKHSERKEVNADRLKKILVSAAKQSKRAWFPKLNQVTAFSDFIRDNNNSCFIAHCNPEYSRAGWKEYMNAGFPTSIMVGPEGDFSEEEIKSASAAGITGLSLGNRRLRTETAAMAVCLPLLLINEKQTEIQ